MMTKSQDIIFGTKLRANNPAITAFQENDTIASRNFHKKIYEEPHKT